MLQLCFLILFLLVIILFSRTTDLKRRIHKLEQKTGNVKESPATQPASVSQTKPKSEQPQTQWNEKLETPTATLGSSKVFDLFSHGNLIAKLGVVILFFGIVFLLKYATDHNMLPLNLRLIAATVFAIGLILLGWLLQPKKQQYGLILQGGGVGLLYCICFISYRLYHLLPADITFIALLSISALATIIALLQNSLTLILLAQLGGFVTPLLAASPQGNELGFFSYYALLNIAITLIAWFKTWRILNVTGFVFTFVLAAIWGFWQYHPQHYVLTQSFLIFFTLLYTMITALFNRQQCFSKENALELILLIGVPLVSFSLQVSITIHQHPHLAINALAYAAFYALTASLLLAINKKTFKLLAEIYLYTTCLFLLLTILLSMSQQWLGSPLALATLLFPLALLHLLEYTLSFHYLPLSTWLIWGAALIGQYCMLRLVSKVGLLKNNLSLLHATSYWLLTISLCALLAQILGKNLHLSSALQNAACGLMPLLAVAVAMGGVKKSIWPFKACPKLYQQGICLAILCVVYVWTLFANLFLWNFTQHMPYIPLFNPIDVMMAFSLITILLWLRTQYQWLQSDLKIQPIVVINLLLAWVFIWISAITLRSVHYWAQVPYTFDAMLTSTIAQTSLTIVWALLSLIVLTISTLRHNKAAWWLGIGLLGLTIAKLFLVDLSNSNTIARIISFIGVGLVLLIIGYFSPVFGTGKKLE